MLLKHKADRRTLAFEAGTLALITLAIALPFTPLLLLTTPVLGFMCFGCLVINHNNKHVDISHYRWLNILNDIAVSICVGASTTQLCAAHIYNHHREYRGDSDWSRYKLAADKTGLKRLWHYWINSSKEMALNRRHLNLPKGQRRRLYLERTAVWSFILIALTLNPQGLIFIIIPSWLIGLCTIMSANLMNHDGCDLQDPWRHSRNFVNRFENYILFNAGYHTIHHLKPATHWSLLRQLHEKEASIHMDETSQEPSFFGFLWNAYLRPQRTKGAKVTREPSTFESIYRKV